MQQKNIVLVGFMGCGKSAVGRRLAKMTHRPLYDTDRVIEQEQCATISEFFAEHGEAEFRRVETEVITRLSQLRGIILSTGGGAMTIPENVEALRRNGVLVHLAASPETILQRVQPVASRPLLAQSENPLETIEELLARRAPFYSQADIEVRTDGMSVHAAAAAVLEALNKR